MDELLTRGTNDDILEYLEDNYKPYFSEDYYMTYLKQNGFLQFIRKTRIK